MFIIRSYLRLHNHLSARSMLTCSMSRLFASGRDVAAAVDRPNFEARGIVEQFLRTRIEGSEKASREETTGSIG